MEPVRQQSLAFIKNFLQAGRRIEVFGCAVEFNVVMYLLERAQLARILQRVHDQ